MEIAGLASISGGCSAELVFGAPSSWEEKFSSRIGHACQLDIDQVTECPCVTCIACTLGESWCTADGVIKMINNGMNILRLNMGVISKEMCRKAITTILALDELSNYQYCTAIVMDLSAECVRTGSFEEGPEATVVFQEGDKVEPTMDERVKNKCPKERIYINTSAFPQLIHHLYKGDRIFFGDGLICLIVKEGQLLVINGLFCLADDCIIATLKPIT
ncbi:Pyruvate kinase PKLR [Taenia crassiceps]|uniref:pyruvate kinase n=1 Tax=Taenia crassiceps TaxID=6207 RepID=A0ABR4QMR3_9CEST